MQQTGEAVRATFTHEGPRFGFKQPVIKDLEGRVAGVRGFGDDARALADQVLKDHARKGLALQLGTAASLPNPQLRLSMNGDMAIVRQQLFKIAYLMTVRVFGDPAITGPSGQLLRTAMLAKTEAEILDSGLQGARGLPLPPGFARSAAHHEHTITCAVLPTLGLATSVDLFGCFTLLAITPAGAIAAQELVGEVVTVDAREGKLSRRTYIDALPTLMHLPEGDLRKLLRGGDSSKT
ncbi:hypothetical protein HK414_13070 [Ramlibacter terrae]|uniref:Uncharacterized protein n=1 Tax=Ramlibacter terrae TaxID=2732511 RepID=A0ABX6P5W3_9BURK|nr:hypothetical protein HK414_13070 [Ramlibacter terrae]